MSLPSLVDIGNFVVGFCQEVLVIFRFSIKDILLSWFGNIGTMFETILRWSDAFPAFFNSSLLLVLFLGGASGFIVYTIVKWILDIIF